MEETDWQVVRSLMEQASDGIFVADRDGNYLDANLRACEMLGRSRSEIIGRHLRDMIAADDLAARPLAHGSLEAGKQTLVERKLKRGDGTTFLAELSATRTTDGRLLSIVRDITSRREAEMASRRAEESFRALLDVLPDAVVVHRGGIIVYVNATTAKLLGYGRPERLVGVPVIEIVAPEDRALVLERVRTMGTTGVAAAVQRERFVRTDGVVVVAEVVALPLRFDGQASFLAVARDLSERERMQALLAQSERLAAVGMLAAGVAHEINNPLAYALLNMERLAEGMQASDSPADQVQCVRDAIDGARRVQRIVRELRTFAGSPRDEGERADVVAALDAALKLADNELRFRARVERHVEPVACVKANEPRLTQVFLNLLLNAAHAIPEHGGAPSEVRVTVRAAGDEVRVSVQDHGVGIAPEHLGHLFDPFFTTRAPGKGMGLGLAICHAAVTGFGGRIEVESRLGEGSTFTVVLPAETSVASVPPPPRKSSPPPAPARRLRLLLAEDERNMRVVLKSLLTPRYEVTMAATGREALTTLESDGAWDIVLCDLLMPEVTGMELYEWLETHRPALCERVVFMTGGAFTDRARELLERTAGRWIEKPFEFEALMELLARAEASAAPAGTSPPAPVASL